MSKAYHPTSILSRSLEHTRFASRPEAFLKSLPHAILHTHGGVIAPKPTAARIAIKRAGVIRTEQGVNLTSETEVLNWLNHRLPQGSLNGYLHRYHQIANHLCSSLDDMRECFYEGALDYARHGTRILEVRTAIKSGPLGDSWRRYEMAGIAFTPQEEFDAVLSGLEAAERESNMKTCLIICIRRSDDPIRATEIVKLAHHLSERIRNKTGRNRIVGIDFVGEEQNYPLKPFAETVKLARSLGFRITAHAGEAHFGSVTQALFNLGIATDGKGIDRIGHGTALARKPSYLLPEDFRVEKNGRNKNPVNALADVMFEACLISNKVCGAQVAKGLEIHTQRFDDITRYWGQNSQGEWLMPRLQSMTQASEYPFKTILAHGGMVCFNPDGNCTLTDPTEEFATASEGFQLGAKELLTLAYYSILHSFISEDEKALILKRDWLPMASDFFYDRLHFDSPEIEMEAFLKAWRVRLAEDVRRESYPFLPNELD